MTLTEAGDIKIPFGKYKEKTLFEILEIDPGYISWLLTISTSNEIHKAIQCFRQNPEVQRLLNKEIK